MSALAQDGAALASAASAAEEALQLERQALSVLRDSWTGETASAATDLIDAHCREGEAVVSALRRAADVLVTLGDSADLPGDQVDAGLADRAPSNFAAPTPPAAAPAPAMNTPGGGGASALPDVGGAIAGLISQIVDALNADPGGIDPSAGDPPADAITPPVTPAAPDQAPEPSVAAVVTEPAPPAAPVAEPVIAPDESAPLPAAEVPPSAPAPAEGSSPDRTPCEIAAGELPQIGE